VRVLFATEGEMPDVNGTLPTGVETIPVRLGASLTLDLTLTLTNPNPSPNSNPKPSPNSSPNPSPNPHPNPDQVRMSAKEIIVIAPAMSLAEGDIRTGRGDPCWNPPCRRTVLSVAINGIDFVEGAVPIEYALPTSTVTTDYWPLTTYYIGPIAHPTYNAHDPHDS